MVLLIIIPIKWLFHWEYTLFSDKSMRIQRYASHFNRENRWESGYASSLVKPKLVGKYEVLTHHHIGQWKKIMINHGIPQRAFFQTARQSVCQGYIPGSKWEKWWVNPPTTPGLWFSQNCLLSVMKNPEIRLLNLGLMKNQYCQSTIGVVPDGVFESPWEFWGLRQRISVELGYFLAI